MVVVPVLGTRVPHGASKMGLKPSHTLPAQQYILQNRGCLEEVSFC